MRKVVVVENELLSALLLTTYLRQQGFALADLVSEGAVAVQAVRQHAPDLIIMGMGGEWNGIEVMKQIRLFSEVPVIYTTHASDAERLAATQPISLAYFLPKPIQADRLVQVLEEAGMSWVP